MYYKWIYLISYLPLKANEKRPDDEWFNDSVSFRDWIINIDQTRSLLIITLSGPYTVYSTRNINDWSEIILKTLYSQYYVCLKNILFVDWLMISVKQDTGSFRQIQTTK